MPEVTLHGSHLLLGAKMGPFGGWDMPIEYTAGTVAEHIAVRNAVGLFDVSHMGKVRILGAGAYDFANSVFANGIGISRVGDLNTPHLRPKKEKGTAQFDGASSMSEWSSNPTGYSGSF